MALEDRIRLPTLNLIHRRRRLLHLLESFVDESNRLITVYAPGGYGKSILLADYAQTTDLPVCWCSLEPGDRDPTAFLTLLAYSITDRFHEIEPDKLLKFVERGDTQASIRRIAGLLTEVGPHIIIIDDYHKAVSAGMTLALNRLLEQLPDASTLFVAARGDMALETGQIIDLLISERATGLSEEELRFTGEEIQLVMRKRFGRRIDLDAAAEIARATDGNIAQVLLTGHLMHAERIVGRLQQRLGDDREIIYQYLAAEVFGKQPPELQRFLLRTALLPEITTELCNDLLDITDAQAQIEELVRNDLFIAQVGAGFRYHDLFAEFLRTKLAEDQALYRQASIRAAKILVDRRRFEEAVSLYLSVRAWDEAAGLLEAEGTFFYNTGRALTLHDWLSQISEEELIRRPRLLLLQGRILNYDLGKPKLAITYFKESVVRFREQDDPVGAAEAKVWQSVGLRMMGKPREALVLAAAGLVELEDLKADTRITAWAIRQRGQANWTMGNTAEALLDLRQALNLFEVLADPYLEGLCHHDVGICLVAQGNISGAEHHYKQELRIWELLGNANDMANALNSLGVSLHIVGRYEEALKYFGDSLGIALQIGATRRAAFAQAGIGDVTLDRQEYDQALEAYAMSTELAREASVQSLEIYNRVKVGECLFQQNDLIEAQNMGATAREIAAEGGLSFEKGLACLLQAKIYTRQGEYARSFDLFAEASASFARSYVLERCKVLLWWSYSLLLDLRSSAAFEQLQAAMSLTLTLGELLPSLAKTLDETKDLLLHFLNGPDIPENVQDNIRFLLRQSHEDVNASRPGLQVYIFGSPTLVVAGRSKRFSQRGGMRKLPEFLAYFLLEGQSGGCRWGEVSAAIWPDLNSNRASSNFHQHLKRLREMIFDDQETILVQDDHYQVNPHCLTWCDALAFDRLFERMAKLAPPAALPLQLELIGLYRGDFLAGFELEEWGRGRQAAYETRFLQVVELAGEHLLQSGEAQEALSIIDKGLAQDYFRERLHRAAFKAYAQLGLFDHLAAHYAELCATFDREFGAPPEPATAALYGQLMEDRKAVVV